MANFANQEKESVEAKRAALEKRKAELAAKKEAMEKVHFFLFLDSVSYSS